MLARIFHTARVKMRQVLALFSDLEKVSKKMSDQFSQAVSRRKFCVAAAATGVSTLAIPTVLTASRTRRTETLGSGEYKYKFNHRWAQLPEKFSWQTTHNVAVDSSGLIYVIHEGQANRKDHPSIFVFDAAGKFVRAFGGQFQGGGHGIEVRKEGKEEFLYVCAYQQVKSFAKMTLRGEVVWLKHAPMESGKYAKGEDKNRQRQWGRNRFMPTNFAFMDDGGFLLADGYGSYFIHRYDKDANWVSCFGGPAPRSNPRKGEGCFQTSHGIWIDRRNKEKPEIVVTDRARNTLQFFDMNFKYLRTQAGFGLPANIDSRGDLLLVPELKGRISLLGKDNKVVAQLGDDSKRINADSRMTIRRDSKKWQDEKFVHPHDACFDADGNIYVAEWVAGGRVTKLEKVD